MSVILSSWPKHAARRHAKQTEKLSKQRQKVVRMPDIAAHLLAEEEAEEVQYHHQHMWLAYGSSLRTCGSSLRTCGSSLRTCGSSLRTCRGQMLIHKAHQQPVARVAGSSLRTCGQMLIQKAQQPVARVAGSSLGLNSRSSQQAVARAATSSFLASSSLKMHGCILPPAASWLPASCHQQLPGFQAFCNCPQCWKCLQRGFVGHLPERLCRLQVSMCPCSLHLARILHARRLELQHPASPRWPTLSCL